MANIKTLKILLKESLSVFIFMYNYIAGNHVHELFALEEKN